MNFTDGRKVPRTPLTVFRFILVFGIVSTLRDILDDDPGYVIVAAQI